MDVETGRFECEGPAKAMCEEELDCGAVVLCNQSVSWSSMSSKPDTSARTSGSGAGRCT